MYAGAVGRIDPSRIARLGGRHALQIKRDGCYVVATTGADGLLSSLTLRSGEPVSATIAAEFRGVRWAPSAVVVGELDLWTERSVRVVAERGYRLIHLHDVLRLGREDLSSQPYHKRRDVLMRAESQLIQDDPDRPLAPSPRTFTWGMPSDGAAPTKLKARPLDPPGTMVPSRIPMSWRRIKVVDQWPAAAFDRVWSQCEADDEEGLVVVALDAPIGRKNAKRKCKIERTIDAVIVSRDRAAATLRWPGGDFVVSATGRNAALPVGAIVEVLCDGLHDRGQPKHPRITRARLDLAPVPQ
jgi:hypothetical protein